MSGAQSLLLDAVGTLIRLREPPAATYLRAARRFGIEPAPEAVERELFRALAQLRPPRCDDGRLEAMPEREREGWRGVIRAVLGDAAADGPCFDALWDGYAEPGTWQALPGAAAALAAARADGLRIAVVSNMDHRLPALLPGLGFQAFDALVLPSNCGYAKPDARMFGVALERLGCPAARALYVGDRERDCVEAARAAGLRGLRFDPKAERSGAGVLRAWSELRAAAPAAGLDSRA